MELNLQQILARIDEPETLDAVTPYWETSLATLPRGSIEWLEPAAIESAARFCGFDAWSISVMQEVADRLNADAPLKALIWHCYRRLTVHPETAQFHKWPSLRREMGERRGVFYLLVGLALVPRIRERHARLEFPERVTRDTCKVFPGFAGDYSMFHHGLGLASRQLFWPQHHDAGRLVRLGRLEWLKAPFEGPVHVYRHNQSGRVIALAEGDRAMTERGLPCWSESPMYEPRGDEPDDEHAWTTRFCVTTDSVTGHVVSPRGFAREQSVTLSLDEWTHRLSRGMPSLDMHIPPGGNLTLERCQASMREATAFFDRYMPDWPYAGFGCKSWIFNTQLQQILPGESNLVRLQEQLYLVPLPTAPTDGYSFVFGSNEIDLDNLPRDTSLQRRIGAFLRNGGRWRGGGGMFYLPEDLDAFGEQPYRWVDDLDAADLALGGADAGAGSR